jgi:putative ABC transport system permease protein
VDSLPADTPTAFLLDVQPHQWPEVEAILKANGALGVRHLPMITARLASVDGESVEALLAEGKNARGRKRWVLTREQRLTVAEALPEDNEVIRGGPFSDPNEPEISVERSFAEDMGCDVGSRLVFDIQGIPFGFVVSSIRTVHWESFHINFFLVAEPGILDEVPQLRIATASLSASAESQVQDAIAKAAPNVTIIRVRDAVERVAGLLQRLGFGVRILGGFAILTGLIILGGAIAATAERRFKETALLKTLGVTRGGVALMLASEYLLVGLVAGAMGASGAVIAAGLFLSRILEVEAAWSFSTLPIVVLLAGLLTVVFGLLSTARALRAPPAATLRS